MIGTPETIVSAEGHIYEPYTDGWAIGYKVTNGTTGEVRYIAFNPSSEDSLGDATVFVYIGDTGDPSQDEPEIYFDIFKADVEPKEYDHEARPDDLPMAGDRCKDCGGDVTWVGPSQSDWMHVNDVRNLPDRLPDLPPHPEHTHCADGCGIDVNHQGPCRESIPGLAICTDKEHA